MRLRQAHEHVVGLHGDRFSPVLLVRGRPQVLLVVEDPRHRHVVAAIDLNLNREQVFGVAQMLSQVGWHLRQIAEHSGEGAPVDLQHGVLRVGNVEGHVPVVGIDDDLHRVANVVDASPLVGL